MPETYTQRPATSEYAPYYGRYVDHVPSGDIIKLLQTQHADTLRLLETLSEEEASSRYGPDKWSIKQVVGHLIDTERIFVFRALAFSRNEQKPLPGFEQDEYVEAAHFDERRWRDLLAEWRVVRAATIGFFRGLDASMMDRAGTASDRPFTVRALAYLVAGHERHHLAILRERYGLPEA